MHKNELATLFYVYVKESLNRYYYPPEQLVARYMDEHKERDWAPVLARFLRKYTRLEDDTLDNHKIHQLAYAWVDYRRVGMRINDMAYEAFMFSLRLSEQKHPYRTFYE